MSAITPDEKLLRAIDNARVQIARVLQPWLDRLGDTEPGDLFPESTAADPAAQELVRYIQERTKPPEPTSP